MTVFSTLQILRHLVLGLFFISVVPLSLQLSELKKSLSAVQSEVQEALQRASTALNNEQQARRDCQEQVCLWCLPILARVSKIPVSFQLNSKLVTQGLLEAGKVLGEHILCFWSSCLLNAIDFCF